MRKDVLLDPNNALLIRNNDFVIGNSDVQHVNDIIDSGPGYYKETPLLGVFVSKYQKGAMDLSVIQREIKTQAASDGYLKIQVAIDKTGKINVGV